MATPGVLLERDDPLAALRTIVDAVDDGTGAAGLVSGTAGIGKTSLLNQLLDEARRDGLVCLSARGLVLEQDFGFGIVQQLFDSLPEDLREAVTATAGSAAAVLDPHLAEPPGTAFPGPPDAVFATLTGLFWATVSLASARRTVIAVDDLQWADAASVRFLDFLSRRLGSVPIAVILAQRTGEPVVDDDVLTELVANPDLVPVELEPLSIGAVRQMVAERADQAPEPEFVRASFDWTLGNPLLLDELLKTVATSEITFDTAGAEQLGRLAPGALSKVVLSRLAHLGTEATEMCRAVAILGDGSDLTVAAAHAELDLERASTAAGRLEEAGVLDVSQGLHFTHPLLRAVVYEDMPGAARGVRHLGAARLLQRLGADPDRVAAQLLLSPPSHDPADAGVLATAAGDEIKRGAPDSAIRLFHRALEEPLPDATRGSVLFGLAMAEASMHRPESNDHLAAASELLPVGTQRAEVDLTHARLLAFSGRTAEALASVARGREALADDASDLTYFLDALEITLCAVDTHHAGRAHATIEHARRLQGETPGTRAAMAACAFATLMDHGSGNEVYALLEPMLQPDTWGFTKSLDGFSVTAAGHLLHHLGHVDSAVGLAGDLLDEAQQSGSAVWFGEAMGMRAYAQYRRGRLAEAESDARAALDASETFSLASPLALAILTYSLLARGETDAAWSVIGSWQRPDEREDVALFALPEAARARAMAHRGDLSGALDQYRRVGELIDTMGTAVFELNPWRYDAALLLSSQDRQDEARELIGPSLEAARALGTPNGLAMGLRALALVEQPVDEGLLQEAVDVLRESSMPLKLARVLIDLGAAWRRSGHRRDAREPLEEGLDLAQASGAVPLVELAQEELRSAGARPRRIQRTGVDALTPSERRVAQLAARGLANREIARQLFVTPKTVETHLSAIFRKLDIHARGELARFDV